MCFLSLQAKQQSKDGQADDLEWDDEHKIMKKAKELKEVRICLDKTQYADSSPTVYETDDIIEYNLNYIIFRMALVLKWMAFASGYC